MSLGSFKVVTGQNLYKAENLFLWSWPIAGGRGGDRGCYLLQLSKKF